MPQLFGLGILPFFSCLAALVSTPGGNTVTDKKGVRPFVPGRDCSKDHYCGCCARASAQCFTASSSSAFCLFSLPQLAP